MQNSDKIVHFIQERGVKVTVYRQQLEPDVLDMRWESKLTKGESWFRGTRIDLKSGYNLKEICEPSVDGTSENADTITVTENLPRIHCTTLKGCIADLKGEKNDCSSFAFFSRNPEEIYEYVNERGYVSKGVLGWLQDVRNLQDEKTILFTVDYNSDEISIIKEVHLVVEELEWIQKNIVEKYKVRQVWY